MDARCKKCGTVNEASNRFCTKCGKKFVAMPDPVQAGEDGVYFCWKHKKEATRVSCGRCEKPICHRCMIVGANGVRCRECARNKVPIKLSGILHDASRSVSNTAGSMGTRPIWYLYIWGMIIRLIMGFFGR